MLTDKLQECWQEDSISEFKSLVMNPSAPLYLVMDVINVDCKYAAQPYHLCVVFSTQIRARF